MPTPKQQQVPEQVPALPPPAKKKHVRSKHCDPKVLEIRKRIQDGCRDNDLASAMEAYEEAISKTIRLEPQSFYNLLNLCDGLERSVHIGTPKAGGAGGTTTVDTTTTVTTTTKEGDVKQNSAPPPPLIRRLVDHKTRQEYVFRIKDRMKTMQLALNETAYTAIFKILSRNKEYKTAEQALAEAETVPQCRPKLRLYSSLLIAYCEEGRMVEALNCWRRVVTTQQLDVSEKEYLALMRCAIVTGDILVMERVLTDLAEDVSVPSKDTVAAILEWFQSAHAMMHKEMIARITPNHADNCQVHLILEDIHHNQREQSEPPPTMGPIVNTNGWDTSPPCPSDTKTGILQTGCLKGSTLQPVPLSARAWEEMTINCCLQ